MGTVHQMAPPQSRGGRPWGGKPLGNSYTSTDEQDSVPGDLSSLLGGGGSR